MINGKKPDTKTAERAEIIDFIGSHLNVAEFEDFCINGLQVEGKERISTIVLGVSSSARLFAEAVQRNADMIIVHHGLFWENDPSPFSITRIMRNRIALLMKHDINLAAYHLPLDAHPETGNNAQILKRLKLRPLSAVDVGFIGELKNPLNPSEFQRQVDEKLETQSILLPFGNHEIFRVLVISGAGGSAFSLADANGADTLLTGEIRETTVRASEELQLNLIIAGHYNTEKLGIQALGQLIERQFHVSCQFIDIPNPI